MAESWQNSILLVCLRKFVRTVREPRKHWISSESVQIHQIVHTHLYECASVPQLWVVQHNHWSHGWPWSHYLRELCSLWWQLRHQSHWSNPVQIWCSKSSQTSKDLGWLVHCVGFIHESSLICCPPQKIWTRDVWSPDPIPFSAMLPYHHTSVITLDKAIWVRVGEHCEHNIYTWIIYHRSGVQLLTAAYQNQTASKCMLHILM